MYARFSIFPADQISEFKAWQTEWREKNPEEIEVRRTRLVDTEDDARKKRPEAAEKISAVGEEAAREITPTTVRDKSNIPR